MANRYRSKLAEIKSQHHRAVLAILESERMLGEVQGIIEKFEQLRPIVFTHQQLHDYCDSNGPAIIIFRRDDLILAGIDVNSWQKNPTS